MKRKKLCPFCRKLFSPNPRLGSRQITCGRDHCKHKQKTASQKLWVKNNKAAVRDNFKDWSKAKPSYWKDYRRDHPDYTKRNRIQTRIRKSLLKTGLQKRIDILQPLVSKMKFWTIAWFAKLPQSISPLLFAYMPPATQRRLIGGSYDHAP